MTKKKLTAISLLATLAMSSAVGGATINAFADEENSKTAYALSSLFSVKGAELDVVQQTDESYLTAIKFDDEGTAYLARNLAYEWRVADGSGYAVKYFTFSFAFESLNFKTVTISMDSESAWATKDEKTTNKLVFTKINDEYFVHINEDTTHQKQIALEEGQKLTVSLGQSDAFGEFKVFLNGVVDVDESKEVGELGVFTNMAGKYGEYVYEEKNPLQITVDMGEDETTEKASVLIYDINGQKFDNATADKKVYDTAAPVLVVNEQFSGFTMGATFSLNYTLVDVIQDTNISKTMEYYQYDPTDIDLEPGMDEFAERKQTLTTSTIIFPMPFEFNDDVTGKKATTMFKEYGYELVAIRFTIGDKTYTDAEGDYAKAVYDLSWYADDTAQMPDSTLSYIKFSRSKNAPTYKYWKAGEDKTENVIIGESDTEKEDNLTDYNKKKSAFEEALAKASENVYAGTNATVYFPSLEWLFNDDNGYRNLKFTISYKMPGSTSASTAVDLAYNKLQLATTKEGTYEFKVFAKDAEGNPMQYYLDGELVDVTADNVWDIDIIPYFSFSVKSQGLKVDDTKNTKRKYTSVLDQTYSITALTVVGANNLQSDYALYKIDTTKYNKSVVANKQLSVSDFSSITYQQIADKLKEDGYTLNTANGDYFALYLKVYASLVAEVKDADATAVLECFEKIGVLDDHINDKTGESQKFEWDPDSRTFKAVEEGAYLVLADYWEEATPETTRAAGYKLVVVETKTLSYTGETDWLKNNVVSVVLFSIAGVLLVVIIILLLVKPSDETLEDLDEKSVKDKKKKE